MEEWKEYKYTDLCTLIGGGTPKTSEPSYWGGDIPWLSVKDFGNDEKYVYSTEKTITEAGLNNSSTKLLRRDDIIISARGTIGAIAMLASEMAFNQSCFGIRSNDIVEQHYLYYLTKTKISELQKNSHGSVFDTITRDTFAKIDCVIPSKKIQRQIASILSSLDDKIEVNRKINENLEQQAQALFNSWFVDFEPFKNGEFVESELGMIPKGWREVELQDVVTIKRGGSPRPIQNFLSLSGYHWLKISDATACQSPYIYEIREYIKESGLSKTVKLRAGSLVLSNSATPGIPKILGVDSCIHDGWLYFPQSKLSKYYLYMLFKEKREFLLSQGNGSVFTNLKTDIVKSMKIAIPNEQILSKFNSLIESLFIQIENKTIESRRLATLRDTLLPKLMSGELRVQDTDLINEMLEKGIR